MGTWDALCRMFPSLSLFAVFNSAKETILSFAHWHLSFHSHLCSHQSHQHSLSLLGCLHHPHVTSQPDRENTFSVQYTRFNLRHRDIGSKYFLVIEQLKHRVLFQTKALLALNRLLAPRSDRCLMQGALVRCAELRLFLYCKLQFLFQSNLSQCSILLYWIIPKCN